MAYHLVLEGLQCCSVLSLNSDFLSCFQMSRLTDLLIDEKSRVGDGVAAHEDGDLDGRHLPEPGPRHRVTLFQTGMVTITNTIFFYFLLLF